MGFFDKLIEWVSPSWAVSREMARRDLAFLSKRGYDAATYSRRTANWRAPATSATAEAGASLHTLRNRSRELTRNNAYAAKAVRIISTAAVGGGIRPAFSSNKAKQIEKIKQLWKRWAEKTECDFDSRQSIYGIQLQAVRAVVESGEALLVRRTNPQKEFALEIQLLEGDYIDDSMHTFPAPSADGSYDFYGIRFDGDGRRIGYWLFDKHPTDMMSTGRSELVPASDVIHIYHQVRPGQHRGVPMGAAAFIRMLDAQSYEEAELHRKRTAACFSVFVRSNDDLSDEVEPPAPIDRLQPGMVQYLAPGEDVSFAAPPPAEGYESYMRQQILGIACAYGVSYEELSGDLSRVNFSSARMGWLVQQRTIAELQQHIMFPAMDRVFQWFTQYLSITQGVRLSVDVEWTAPRREMIDPVKETTGMVQIIRAGLKSYQEVAREMGYEPDDTLKEMQEFYKKIDEYGLKLSSDLRAELQPSAVAGDGVTKSQTA